MLDRLLNTRPTVPTRLRMQLADWTARSMIGYWHDRLSVCLSVGPSICDAVFGG